MDGCTRPLVLGYIRARVVTTAEELAAEKVGLAAFALAEGFTLGTVYLEYPATAPAAFEALLEEVRRDNDVWAVVVPTVQHVTDGGLRAMRREVEHHGTVHLVVAAPAP